MTKTVIRETRTGLEFVAAQFALLEGVESVDSAFTASAVACFKAWTTGRMTLPQIAALNKDRNADYRQCAGARYLYTSPEAITIHALTGSLLVKGDDDGADEYLPPVKVQTIVNRVKRQIGVDATRQAIGQAVSIGDGVAILLAIEEQAKKDAAETETDESGTDSDESDETSTSGETSSVETLLSRAVLHLQNGTPVSDASRELIAQLAKFAVPAALTVVA